MDQVAAFSCAARADVVTMSTILTKLSRLNYANTFTGKSFNKKMKPKCAVCLEVAVASQKRHFNCIPRNVPLFEFSGSCCRFGFFNILLNQILGLCFYLITLFGMDGDHHPVQINCRHCCERGAQGVSGTQTGVN